MTQFADLDVTVWAMPAGIATAVAFFEQGVLCEDQIASGWIAVGIGALLTCEPVQCLKNCHEFNRSQLHPAYSPNLSQAFSLIRSDRQFVGGESSRI